MKTIKIWTIAGYWKNDNEKFDGLVICSEESTFIDDDQVFFYMTEDELFKALKTGVDNDYEFVITNVYKD